MSQDPLNIDESSNVDDKAPLWIYVNKIEKLAGGGSWRFECKFCSNSYVGSHSRVMTHLLQEGKGIKGCLKVRAVNWLGAHGCDPVQTVLGGCWVNP
ncbi:hypothetical protein DY000_02063451 [Brassica cretica]|uniref:BED-type domain-containing protein n=1 Tax=Brassica cretica TaxID=69181 RepID=A0ABQ7ATM2_BRACR|nr:hypothetical protein DY000_02063451 [Brassica cretica]